MEITIGVRNVARELTVDVPEDADAITKIVKDAMAKSKDDPGAALEFTATSGRHVVVPVSALAFVEFGGDEQRRVGFGAL